MALGAQKKFTCSRFQSEFECDFTATDELTKIIEIAERHEVEAHDYGDSFGITQKIIDSLEDA